MRLAAFIFLASCAWPQSLPFGYSGVSGGGVTNSWTVVQAKFFDRNGNGTGGSSCSSNTSTCTVNVSAVGAGHAIIAFSTPCCNGTQTTLSSISGETSTDCTSCDAGQNNAWNAVRYVTSATGGETSFTCTLSASSSYISCGIIELKWTGAAINFDVSGSAASAGCTSCAGPTLSPTGSNDAIVEIFNLFSTNGGGVSGTGWVPTLDGGTCCSGISVATHINTNSGAAPTFSQSPSDAAVISGIALSGSLTVSTWSVIQSKYYDRYGNGTGGSSCATNTTTCTVNVSSVTAGDVLVAFAPPCCNTTSVTLSSISGETTTECTSCEAADSGNVFNNVVRYTTSATGGETSFTCTFSTSIQYIGCGIIELRWTGSTVAFDTGGTTNTSCSSCAGPTLTLSGSNDAIVQLFNLNGTNSGGISGSGWVASLDGGTCCSGISVGTHINTGSGSPPTFTQSPSTTDVISGIAFKGQ